MIVPQKLTNLIHELKGNANEVVITILTLSNPLGGPGLDSCIQLAEQDNSATCVAKINEFVNCSVDVPDCPSMYINAESYPSHSNTEDTLGKKCRDCFPCTESPLLLPWLSLTAGVAFTFRLQL